MEHVIVVQCCDVSHSLHTRKFFVLGAHNIFTAIPKLIYAQDIIILGTSSGTMQGEYGKFLFKKGVHRILRI